MSTPDEAPHGTTTIQDCFGHAVRLAEERIAHIGEHPEMKEMGEEIQRILTAPQTVRRSRSDDSVRLFYECHARTIVGGKWLCVVVKTFRMMRSPSPRI